jgi:hypothetical protein
MGNNPEAAVGSLTNKKSQMEINARKRMEKRRKSFVEDDDEDAEVGEKAPVTNRQIKFYDIVQEDESMLDHELSVRLQ